MNDFAPTLRAGETLRRTPHGNWFWKCPCGFEASCSEDVGGHRASCRERSPHAYCRKCGYRFGGGEMCRCGNPVPEVGMQAPRERVRPSGIHVVGSAEGVPVSLNVPQEDKDRIVAEARAAREDDLPSTTPACCLCGTTKGRLRKYLNRPGEVICDNGRECVWRVERNKVAEDERARIVAEADTILAGWYRDTEQGQREAEAIAMFLYFLKPRIGATVREGEPESHAAYWQAKGREFASDTTSTTETTP